MTIKDKVFRVIFFTSLGAVLLLSAVLSGGILLLRRYVSQGNGAVGQSAALKTEETLVSLTKEHLLSIAQDRAQLADERFEFLEKRTRILAEFMTRRYTSPEQYPLRPIDFPTRDAPASNGPFLIGAPDFSLDAHRTEVYLAATIGDLLLTMQRIDLGIEATDIGTESGFTLLVDRVPMTGEDYYHFNDGQPVFDARTRPWYEGAKQRGGIFWTDIYAGMGPEQRETTIGCAMPFYDLSKGEKVFKGVASNGFDAQQEISAVFSALTIGQTGYLFVLNHTGQIIFSSKTANQNRAQGSDQGNAQGTAESEALGKALGFFQNFTSTASTQGLKTELPMGDILLDAPEGDLQSLARKMTGGQSGIDTLELDGKAVYAAYAPLSTIGWSLALVVPMMEVLAPLERIQNDIISRANSLMGTINRDIFLTLVILLGIIGADLGVIAFCSQKFARGVTAPIIALNEDAKIISSGNLDHPLVVRTGDEIETLAKSFNHLISSIHAQAQETERVEADIKIAARVQASLLVTDFPVSPDFAVYGEVQPAREVGGDFYDVFYVDKSQSYLALVMADVTGRGLASVLFTVIAKTLIRSHIQTGRPLDQVMDTVNHQLCESNEEAMFLSVFLCIIDLSGGMVEYSNAGQQPPLIARTGELYKYLDIPKGLPLGVKADASYRIEKLKLVPGDRLYFYTKGIVETENPAEETFGRERLLETVNKFRDAPPRKFDEAVRRAVTVFLGEGRPFDDWTTLVFYYQQRTSGPFSF